MPSNSVRSDQIFVRWGQGGAGRRRGLATTEISQRVEVLGRGVDCLGIIVTPMNIAEVSVVGKAVCVIQALNLSQIVVITKKRGTIEPGKSSACRGQGRGLKAPGLRGCPRTSLSWHYPRAVFNIHVTRGFSLLCVGGFFAPKYQQQRRRGHSNEICLVPEIDCVITLQLP